MIISKAKTVSRRSGSLRECEEEGDEAEGVETVGVSPLFDAGIFWSSGVIELDGEVVGPKEAEPCGDCVSVGGVVGPRDTGPGAGRGAAEALHLTGTPGMPHARGREMARVRLIGILMGTLAVTIRHRQSKPVPEIGRA